MPMKLPLPTLRVFARPLAIALGLSLSLASASAATSAWTQWRLSDGGNGHWYRVVDMGGLVSWTNARDKAASDGGYLATITSSAENDFVFALVNDSGFWHTDPDNNLIGPWIGGSFDDSRVFSWTTGEASAFNSWLSGEPNEEAAAGVEFFSNTSTRKKKWADAMMDDEVGPYAFVEESLNGPVSAPQPNFGGMPIDLNGAYLAARDATVGATTDPGGIGAAGMVQEPAMAWRFTPYSKTLKKPMAAEGFDLRGASYGFDVDLCEKSRWPNPTSVPDWWAGNAADGHIGSTLVIRAAGSNGSGAIDLSNMNGLRILFYRKDGKFFGHVANLWYGQDVDLPGATVATKYRVQVDVAGNGAVRVCFKQLNGTGNGATAIFNMAGGSIENGGLSAASFLVQMVNLTDPACYSAPSTKAVVSHFWTSAARNSLFAYCSTPYLSTASSGAYPVFGLYNTTLGAPVMGYQVSTKLVQSGGSAAYYSGQYENTTRFEASSPVFGPTTGGRFDHSQSTAFTAKATALDLLLESYNFFVPQGSSNTGQTVLKVLANYHNTTALPGFLLTNSSLLTANVFDSNGIVFDPVPPSVGAFKFKRDGSVLAEPLTYGDVDISLTATDAESGLADAPLLHATLTDNHGNVTTKTIRLGSVNPVTGSFGTTLKVPIGTASIDLTADVCDHAGNSYTTPVKTVAVVVPPSPTLSLPIHLTGFNANGSVDRLVRIVLGRKGGDGRVGTHSRIVINKVVTFDADGNATVTLTHDDGLPEFAEDGITHVWVKDPFHTLGNLLALKLEGATYSLRSAARVNLTPGDVTNNNVIDGAEYSIFTNAAFGDVNPNTTTLSDTSALIPSDQINLDLNGDGKFDDKDLKQLNKYFGVVGDPEPEDYF